MNSENKNTRKRFRLPKWLLISIVLVLLLLTGVRWLMQSDLLLNYLRDTAETEVSARISGSLSIEDLNGDLWKGIRLTGVKLRDEHGDILLAADSLKAEYSVLNLIKQPYELEEMVVSGLQAYGDQNADGVWNFEKLTTAGEDEPSEEDSGMPWWKINQLRFHQSSAQVISPQLPDGEIRIDQLEFEGRVGYVEDEWSASVDELRFLLDENRLPQPVEFGASASVEGESITLEQLLVNTGRSMIRSRAEAESTRQFSGDLELAAVSWRDIQTYTDIPLQQDLEGDIDLEGSLEDLRVRIDLRAKGMEGLALSGRFHLGEEPSLSEFSLEIRNFDGPLFSGETDTPRLESLDLTGNGNFIFNQFEESHFSGDLSMRGIKMNEYELAHAGFHFDWMESSMGLQLDLNHNEQTLAGELHIRNIFTDQPGWELDLSGSRINLAGLMNDPDYESHLEIEAEAAGCGFELSEEEFTLGLQLSDSRWGNQSVDQLSLNVRLSEHDFSGLMQAAVGESRMSAEFDAREWQNDSMYDFTAQFSEFNLSDLQGFDDFQTDLNATVSGEGAYFSLEDLDLMATVQFDTSFVNDEEIDHLKAVVRIQNQIAVVTDAELASPVADAAFSFRQHIQDFRYPGNTLDMDVRIKDVSVLAPVLEVETIQATGDLTGRLYRRDDGELQFDSELRLAEIAYDTLFTIGEIEGAMSVLLLDDPEISLDLDIYEPAAEGYRLQLASLNTRTTWQDTLFTGSVSLDLQQDDENSFSHAGTYRYTEDDLYLKTEEIVLRTPQRALSLQRPFEATWKDQIVMMDTLHIRSPEGSAYLQMSIPWLSEDRQEVEVEANLLNLGTIQRLILEESFAESLVSGHLNLLRENEEITSDASLLFEQIRMNEGIVDSLKAEFNVENRRLAATVGAWHENSELLSLSGNLPFEPENPLTFDDEFLEQPIEGEILIPSTPISFWRPFLGDDHDFESEGNFSWNSVLEGTAGDPVFTGQLELTDGVLSGIPIDLIEFGVDYRHELTNVRLDGAIHSRGSRIAGIEAILPLDLDLKALRVNLPADEDEINVSAQTDDLNLAILNDFLDRDTMRDLRGRISGNLEITGTVDSPEPSGTLRLSGGSLRIVPAAVGLADISANINLNPEQIQLESFSMRSGPGSLTASGNIELFELQPGNLDIQLQANQFRAVNTADMNTIVDVSSQLRGTTENPILTGAVNFRSGFVNLQNFGEQSIEDVRLEEEEEPESSAFYDSLAAEMNVEFDRQFFIRNRQYLDMEVELSGIIDLVKEPNSELELFGSIEGVRGYAQPLGRNFELEEAVVTFYGPIDNPELLIRTFYRPPQAEEEVTVWYIIDGTVEDPDFRFESEPVLELQDIISYTLFGRPFYALESWQQAVSGGGQGSTASDVALDLLLDRVELLAAQQLGIDVVQVDTNRTGSGSSTTIKTGWYLNDRTFFAVLNEIAGTSPKTMFQLEYMIRRNLEFIITQGDDSREGVDLRWNIDY